MAHVTHAVRGRLRLRYPIAWFQSRRPTLEQRLRGTPGVRSARGSDLTGSLVVDYDPFTLAEHALLETLDTMTGALGAPSLSDKGTPATKIDVQRNALVTLLGTTGVLGLTGLPLPAPVLAGLVVAGGLPTFGRAARSVVR